jgi:hypothetical protein
VWWRTTAASGTSDLSSAGLAGGDRGTPRNGVELGSYAIEAKFRVVRAGSTAVLRAGDRIQPGDRLYLTVDASVPVYLYVVNQDEKEESYLLFPLPAQVPANPLPAGRVNRVPGVRHDEQVYWQVTSAGGREHFFVFASPQRVPQFEDRIAALPAPQLDKPVVSAVLPKEALAVLRGVGGLTKADPTSKDANWRGSLITPPLLESVETTRGLWAREIVFDNPGR